MSAETLTEQQLVLLIAVARGASQQQLAARFGVSHPAVSKQLRAVRVWLGAETVAHAVHLATLAGLIPDAGPSEALDAPRSAVDAESGAQAVREPAGPSRARSAAPGDARSGPGVENGPQTPANEPEAPEPHPTPARRSGDDPVGFNGVASPSSRPGDSGSDPRRAEKAPEGVQERLTASTRPSLASRPNAPARHTMPPREVEP